MQQNATEMQHRERDRERDREKSIEQDKEIEPEKESATDVAEETVKVPCCKKLKAVVYLTNFVRISYEVSRFTETLTLS